MDPQLQQRMMLFAGLIPGAISFALLLVAWYLHALRDSKTDLEDADTPRDATPGPRWMIPILIVLGVAGVDYAQNYGFKLWPDNNTYRYTHAAALLALAAVAEGLVRLPMLGAVMLRLLAYAAVFLMLTEGYTQTILGGSANLIAYTLFASIAATLVATAADAGARLNHHDRELGWLDALTWCMILGVTMPVLLENRFAMGAMYPAGVISVLVAAAIVGLIFRSLSLARGTITVLVGFHMLMLAGSIVQAGVVNLPSVLLIASLPLVTLIPLRSSSGLKRLLARAGFIALIAGAAMTTLHAPKLSFWPGADSDAASEQDQSLDDYYNSLE